MKNQVFNTLLSGASLLFMFAEANKLCNVGIDKKGYEIVAEFFLMQGDGMTINP